MKDIIRKFDYCDSVPTEIIKGTIGLLCNHCKKISYRKAYVSIGTCPINMYISPVLSYEYRCDHCKEIAKNAEPIDPNIAETIAILNSKGYYTIGSSEGHIDCGEYIPRYAPYIDFLFAHQYEVMFKYPLPGDWVWTTENENDDRFMIEDTNFEDVDKDHILEYKEQTLDLIKKWAESLPTSEELKLNYHNGNLINDEYVNNVKESILEEYFYAL